MIYLDTPRAGGHLLSRAQCRLGAESDRGGAPRGLIISAWTLTKMASVGAIKERTGVVYCATRRQALALFQRFGSSTLGITEIEPVDFCAAALLMDGPGPLRGGDAQHLAVAKRLPADLATLDRRLADVAPGCGVPLFPVG